MDPKLPARSETLGGALTKTGVVSGMYIWNVPLQQATGRLPAPAGEGPVGQAVDAVKAVKEGKYVKAAHDADEASATSLECKSTAAKLADSFRVHAKENESHRPLPLSYGQDLQANNSVCMLSKKFMSCRDDAHSATRTTTLPRDLPDSSLSYAALASS